MDLWKSYEPNSNLPKPNKNERLKYHIDLIKNWPKTSEVFALNYGTYIIGGATLFCGIFFNQYFRRKFRLMNYGTVSTYLPICIMPPITSMLFHTEFVLEKILLIKDQCPICLQVRSAALQTVFGAAFPLIIAPLGCAAISQKYLTFDIPTPVEYPKEVFSILKKMFKPISKTTQYIFVGQFLLGFALTHFEIMSFLTVREKLAKQDQSIS